MNDQQQDDGLSLALLVLAGVIALVLTGVVTLAAATAGHGRPVAALAAAPSAAADDDVHIDFETGSAALPPEASERLVRLADAARADLAKTVQITGYQDTDDNAKLANARALAVRHALEANGVAPERLLVGPPVVVTSGGDARDARRVAAQLR